MTPFGRMAAVTTSLAAANFIALNAWHSLAFGPHKGLERGPDGSFAGYSYEAFNTWVQDVQASGQSESFLAWHSRLLDLTFPAVLTLALALLTVMAGRLMPRFAAMKPAAQWASAMVFGLPYLLFDYTENLLVARMVAAETVPDAASVSLASSMTTAKWAFVALALALPAVLALAAMLLGKRGNHGA